MKIGIYDSGIGGLSVLHRALKKMPEAEFIYYADTKHVPYGEKTREQIKGYVEEVLNFLIAKEVDAIVIACNTATSVATKEFRGEFAVPIVGMEPAVKRALKLYQDMQKRISGNSNTGYDSRRKITQPSGKSRYRTRSRPCATSKTGPLCRSRKIPGPGSR